jgi:hypothetical protein
MNNNSMSLSYNVSNFDIQKKVHYPVRIITYPELANCNDILSLLPNPLSLLVILYETGSGSGHWTVLCRRNDTLCFFDSYGLKYDNELNFINNSVRKQLHENPYLTRLLNTVKKQGYTVIYNKKRLPQFAPNISTCGKYVIAFANASIDGITLNEFLKSLEQTRKESKLSYDEIVNELYQMF